jgi:nitrogen fixation NifU-like protein
MSDLYQEIILEELKNPRHQGTLEGENVRSHHGVNASCGDEVTLFVRVPGKDEPIEIKWQGTGCAISMASMSLLADTINTQQMTVQQIKELKESDLLELLGLDQITTGRVKCMMLGLRTIRKIMLE